MEKRYVIDSVAFINYFNQFFEENNQLSNETRKILDKCFNKRNTYYFLVIPSIVFIEIFRKFLKSEELVRKFYYDIYLSILDNETIEIKPIEKEVLQIFQKLYDFKLEHHDRLVFATSIQLYSILITRDPDIIKYNKKRNLVPRIIF